MSPTPARRSAPAPDTATILFIGNLRDALGGGSLGTIWDEKAAFVGELADVSAFEARVAPGRHTFCAGWLAGGPVGGKKGPATTDAQCGGAANGGCFVGDFAAGKYYVAWLRYSNEAGEGAIAGWHKRWLFPHPGSKTLSAPQALAAAAKLAHVTEVPMFVPDVPRGQALVEAYTLCKPPGGDVDVNPATWGYDRVP